MFSLQADSAKTRAAVWIAERFEKARHLEGPDRSLLERTFLAVESSVETGLLGQEFLGTAVYSWILIFLVVLLLVWLLVKVYDRFARALGVVMAFAVLAFTQFTPKTATLVDFYSDDPLQVDPDTLPFPVPAPRQFSEAYNFLINVIGLTGAYEGPAVNVNTVGDVPESSWFVNRYDASPPTLEELRRGPNLGPGPDTSRAWNVVEVERDGKSVGMQIVDGRGDRYILKLDPRGFPEVSTGAEIVTTKFLHALGYHVPENYLVRFTLEMLQPGREHVAAREIERILRRAYRYEDGTYRALASKYIDGQPIGPYQFFGTRPDDANDVFPHELRRELRGLRVVSAWLNHTDIRAENTLTSAIPVGEKAYVRHYLIDFGTTLGGSPLGRQRRWAGHEYLLDPIETVKRWGSFGLYDPPWKEVETPNIRGVGRFGSDLFSPERWVPIQPNAAFRRMDDADAFWAASRIARFSDEEIRAIVSTGNYQDTSAVAFISDVLIERRARILRAYLSFGGGVDQLRMSGSYLVFVDLLEELETNGPLPRIGANRTVRWLEGDSVIAEQEIAGDSLHVPTGKSIERVEILKEGYGMTRVYFDAGRVAGVERCGADGHCDSIARRQALRRELFSND